jgi:hypothetical protein
MIANCLLKFDTGDKPARLRYDGSIRGSMGFFAFLD